jgi:hypothetical protein
MSPREFVRKASFAESAGDHVRCMMVTGCRRIFGLKRDGIFTSTFQLGSAILAVTFLLRTCNISCAQLQLTSESKKTLSEISLAHPWGFALRYLPRALRSLVE